MFSNSQRDAPSRKFILVICGLLLALHAEARAPQVIGEAYALDDGRLLYRELHFIENTRRRVEYRLPDGGLLAQKQLDYNGASTQPSLQQRNWVSGREIEVRRDRDSLAMSYRPDAQRPLREARLVMSRDSVIDAGFDEFVRQHWQPLLAGKTLDFDFLALTRQQWVPLKMQRQPCPGRNDGSMLCLQVKAANPLLRLLLEPINLEYRDKQLQRFTGVSNISDAKGRALEVDITYRYQGASENLHNNFLSTHSNY
ncbi:hypothetical protein HBA55_25830 [Pseudomaricurvus alkylphenolicus]|uniref:hypothetical protein n=1 Tax=Pseudomaricurvus alkylphenolicus TaxID=1306991 RepID=UPI001421E0FE|nr:hypothetical protein [Pseudomaricurvus alkylphenolicus]NIB43055.1 hypothetical protein [Pseudomaricurvus alkylphenolicus]